MKKPTFIIILSVLLITLLTGAMLLISNLRPTEESGLNNNHHNATILGQDDPDSDSFSIKTLGDFSRIENHTHQYSIDLHNSWAAEVQKDALRIYSTTGPEEDKCLISTHVYTNQAPELKDEEIRTEHGRINLVVEDIESIGTGNYGGKILKEYENGKITAETVYITKNDRTYSFTSFYGVAHGGEALAEYQDCNFIFGELLDTFTIN